MLQFWSTFLDNLVFLICINPLAGAGLTLASSRWGRGAVRRTAVVNVVVTCGLAVLMVANYNVDRTLKGGRPQTMQMVTCLRWLAQFDPLPSENAADSASSARAELSGPDIEFALGVDGVSLWLVAMTAFVMLPAVFLGEDRRRGRPEVYYALLLLLQAVLMGIFAAADIVLFYICLELSLAPLVFLTGIWGGCGRRQVIERIFVYQLAGSLLVLLGLCSIVIAHFRMQGGEQDSQTPIVFSIEQLTVGDESIAGIASLAASNEAAAEYWRQARAWIFCCLLVGFAVKAALFPFHTWLRHGSGQLPPAAGLLATAIAIEVGSYGFLRFMLPLFLELCLSAAEFLSAAAVAGVVYAGLISLAERDLRKLVATWSIAHMGLCAAGIFSLNMLGAGGAVLQLAAHGLSAACLLTLACVLGSQFAARRSDAIAVSAHQHRRAVGYFVIAVLAAIAVPGSAGFAGQLATLLGVFRGASAGPNPVCVLFLLLGMLMIAWSFLRLLPLSLDRSTGYADIDRSSTQLSRSPASATRIVDSDGAHIRFDATGRPPLSTQPAGPAIASLMPLLGIIVWMGLQPQFFLLRIQPSLARILATYPARIADNQQGSRQADLTGGQPTAAITVAPAEPTASALPGCNRQLDNSSSAEAGSDAPPMPRMEPTRGQPAALEPRIEAALTHRIGN